MVCFLFMQLLQISADTNRFEVFHIIHQVVQLLIPHTVDC